MNSTGEDIEYECIGLLSDIPSGKAIVRIINEHEIAIFHLDNAVYAVSNICTHQHSPVIAEGIVQAETVTCPLHGWCYDLKTGNLVGGGGGLESYRVKVEEGNVFVERPKQTPSASWFDFEMTEDFDDEA